METGSTAPATSSASAPSSSPSSSSTDGLSAIANHGAGQENGKPNQSNQNQPTNGAPIDSGKPHEGSPSTESQLFEIKVNGTPRKYTLDELIAKARFGEAAHERFERANQKEKFLQAHRERLKADPVKALLEDKELGLTPEQIRDRFENWYKQQFIDPEILSKEELKIRELENWKAEKEAQEKAHQEELEKKQNAAMDAHAMDSLQKEIVDALEKSGLPKTRQTIKDMAFFMKQNLMNGFDAPMDVIVNQVKENSFELFRQYVKDASGAQLVEWLGPDLVKKLRMHDMEQLKSKFNQVPQSADGTVGRREPRKHTTMADVDRYFNELRRSK